MDKVLPCAFISPECRKALECVRLYLYDLTGEVYDDDQLLHFLAIDFLANVPGDDYFPF